MLKNVKIFVKVIIIVLIGAIGLLSLSIYGILKIKETNTSIETIYVDRVIPLKQLKIVSDMYAINFVDTLHKVRNKNITIKQGIDNINTAGQAINENIKKYENTYLTNKEKEIFDNVKKVKIEADEIKKEVLDYLEKNDTESLAEFTKNKLYQKIDPLTDRINELINLQIAISEQEYMKSQQRYKEVIQTFFMSILFTVAILIVFSVFIIRSIVKSLKNVSDISFDLAKGDLTRRLDASAKDETGEMSKNFNQFIKKLQGIMTEIKDYSMRVASGTGQLSATMEQISVSVEELGNSSTTTAAAVEEMSATTNTVYENVDELSKNAESTLKLAKNGGDAVNETINEINKIKSVVEIGTNNVADLANKTNSIGEIITVINDIASQTNLLALNAAIEAARAGEAGKGFEVVAEEVRKLSENTTEATKEISVMIKDIQARAKEVTIRMEEVKTEVEIGVKKAKGTGGALDEIVNETMKLSDMVNMIVSSIKEQSIASEEIAEQTEKVTQSAEENGRAVEQSTEAIRDIADIAEQLDRIIDQFKV